MRHYNRNPGAGGFQDHFGGTSARGEDGFILRGDTALKTPSDYLVQGVVSSYVVGSVFYSFRADDCAGVDRSGFPEETGILEELFHVFEKDIVAHLYLAQYRLRQARSHALHSGGATASRGNQAACGSDLR